MPCEKIKQVIVDYIEGRLDNNQKTEIEKHCAECPQCAASLEQYKGLIGSLKKLKTNKVPEGLIDRICSAVDEVSISTKNETIREKQKPIIEKAFSVKNILVVAVFAVCFIIVGINYKKYSHVREQVIKSVEIAATAKISEAAKQEPGIPAGFKDDINKVETIVVASAKLLNDSQKDSSVFRGTKSEINNELKSKINSNLNAIKLNSIVINKQIEQILYRRALRLNAINKLKKRTLVFENSRSLLELKHGAAISLADKIMVEEENNDTELLAEIYAEALRLNKDFEDTSILELKEKIISIIGAKSQE
ncbi:MAG: zf-HC2 domain-containing protein [Elusimicrobia bacterium]|nr:zf-HC2 domain-containing protein [Candidatus Liberimonas magnetica]